MIPILTATPRALKEINEINEAINKYQTDIGEFPESLLQLIGNNPLRKGWEEDNWGNPYLYTYDQDEGLYKLVSFGKDGMENSKDDLIYTNK